MTTSSKTNNKMTKEKKIEPLTIINALIERFDDLEEEGGTNFSYARRIILRFARKNHLNDKLE